MEKALLAAGCFWGVEASFKNVPGVVRTTVGYTGGHVENPTYQEVCSGKTGHAEAVLVEYDPKQTTFEKLLDVFWSIHDPTTLNRQGVDEGSQYRSAIFFQNSEQEKTALRSKERQKGAVTEIVPAGPFWRAEEYHQCYLEKRGH
jgi:peptide-methionine (S)-S-oxide reductase